MPAHDDWAGQVEAIRESEDGRRATDDQARRAAAFQQLVEQVEKESATVCEMCGAMGSLSRTVARSPWYGVRCDECREDGWIVASEGHR